MAEKDQEALAPQVEQTPIDDWAAAFAALDQRDEEAAEADAESPGAGAEVEAGDDVPDTDHANAGEVPAADAPGDGEEPADLVGGPGDLGGADGGSDEDLGWIGVDLTEEDIKRERERVVEEVRERTITDVVNAYIKQGVRHVDGRLGADINDLDICKRDSDGVPRFYNPETGREFTGDNPRRQAQEWVDDYNRDIAKSFNKTCQDYSKELLKQEEGRLAIIEFAPKYKQMDPVRRSMFESIIEDYEVTDKDGNIVAYNCDLNKAMAAVNRQVKVIQDRFARQAAPAAKPAAPSGPALDTPSTSPSAQKGGKPEFKSIEEAMEWEQDQLLARANGGKR